MASGRDFLGPYRLVRLIRSGNTCQVWEAIRDPNPERIAVKVLLIEHARNKDEIEQLRHEAEVGQSLDHPAVIKIHEFNGKHELPFVAMELFNARNLKQEMRENADSVAFHAPELIRKGAQGLEHLHGKGWIHCDVKPDNFLVRGNDVRLIDFSIAEKAKRSGGIGALFGFGKGSKVRGTRSYMSPEQIRGQNLTASADIYSFGCMIFEVFAGRPPFAASSPNDLLNRHLKSPAPSILPYASRVSPELNDLLMRMMAKTPAQRPESMKAFLSEYERIQVYRAGMRPAPPAEPPSEDGPK